MMRKIIFTGLFFLLSFLVFFKQEVYAQTSCPDKTLYCKGHCLSSEDDLGKLDCSSLIPHCCIPKSTPTPTPSSSNCPNTNLYCKGSCLSSEDDLGKLNCSGLIPHCCVPHGSGGSGGSGSGGAQGNCPDPNQIETALGCVPTDTTKFVGWVLSKVIGLAGGIAFLLFIYAGFLVITSHGDPEKLNNGKEIIVSTLAGLLMIVFSVILLRIIGVDILQIPGFKK